MDSLSAVSMYVVAVLFVFLIVGNGLSFVVVSYWMEVWCGVVWL